MAAGRWTAGEELPPHRVVAFNYASDSENKIHEDATARRYGFRGGLVPGVADFAYLTRPVVEALGQQWLERGGMSARFRQPVYHGDTVTAHARVAGADPPRFMLELRASSGLVCAVGEAWLDDFPAAPPPPSDYPRAALPPFEARPPAGLGSLPVGRVLGSLPCGPYEVAEVERLARHTYRDDHPCYRGAAAVVHPAHLLHEANSILRHNVALGPWIHTASAVRTFALRDARRPAFLRGTVAEASERNGNESVVLDLLLVDGEERALAHVRHRALVRLR